MNDLLGGELNTFHVLAMLSPRITHQPKCIQKLVGWCDATIIHEIPLFVPIYMYLYLRRIYNNLDGHQSFYVALTISGIYREFELLNQSENMYSWNFYKYIHTIQCNIFAMAQWNIIAWNKADGLQSQRV